MSKKFAVALLVTGLAASAAAQSNLSASEPTASPQSKGKIYLVADIGSASYKGVTVTAGTYPNPGTASFAGGYRITNNLSAELGFTTFGRSGLTSGTTTATLTASSFHLDVVGNLPVSESFELLGMLGVANNSHQLEVTSAGSTSTYSGSATGVAYGLGVQLTINRRFALRALYKDLGSFGKLAGQSSNDNMTVSTFTVGGSFTF